MLDPQNSFNRSASSTNAAKSPVVKLGQLSATAILLCLALLSGCNKKAPSSSPTTSTPAATNESKPTATAKIDVNSAPIAELDKLELPGTKPSLSERIQGKRPYKNADDLVTKKAISADEYKLIQGLIVVGKAK